MADDNSTSLRFSIVIPTFRRPDALRRCLQSLVELDIPDDAFDVVVVDDGASDDVQGVARSFEGRLEVQYIAQTGRSGPAKARNAGAAAARGVYIAFLDDDCIPEPGWLRAFHHATIQHAGERVLFGGRVINALPGNLYAVASQNLIDFLYQWYNADHDAARFFASNNLACAREAFLEQGGFDPLFRNAAAEDRDFCDRWRESGGAMVYVPSAVVRHLYRDTLGGYLRQHVGYGRGAVDLHEGRDRRQVSRPRLEPLTFYRKLLFHPVGRGFGRRTVPLVALAFASQAAYAWGYFTERWRRQRLTSA